MIEDDQTRSPGVRLQAAERGFGSEISDWFSLVEGGPIYRIQCWLALAMPNRPKVIERAALSIGITWIPLLILSVLQHESLSGVEIPFLRDIAVNVQFLISLPLLIGAETLIDPKVRRAVRHFVDSGLVTPPELPAFEAAVSKTLRLRDALWPSIILVALAFLPSVASEGGELFGSGLSNWHILNSRGGGLSMAGRWFAFVSAPLYRLWLFRWIWLIIVWTTFLARVARLELAWIPTHPDRAAGLGFLAHTQLSFGLIGFAGSTLAAAKLANMIAFEGKTLSDLKALMIVFSVFISLVLAAPMLVFCRKLREIKEKGLFEYGTLGTHYVQAFDAKWNRLLWSEQENLLGTPDIQSLADLSNSFAIVASMRSVLLSKEILLKLLLPAVLPMLLLVLAETPTQELLRVLRLLG